jgi:hypothetical protein
VTLPSSAAADPPVEEHAAAKTIPERRPERVCPNCGAALYERKCKLLCPEPACGYYMSCSDFY